MCKDSAARKGITEVYRGHEIAVNLLRKVQLQIAVNEEFVEPTINAIIKGGRTRQERRNRRRQDLRPAAGRLHSHPHRRTRQRSHLKGVRSATASRTGPQADFHAAARARTGIAPRRSPTGSRPQALDGRFRGPGM